jgi:plastocyanin
MAIDQLRLLGIDRRKSELNSGLCCLRQPTFSQSVHAQKHTRTKMRFTFASAALSLATIASATVFQVQVGENGLSFTPSTVTASPGDQVQFIFNPSNHSATQSTFSNPCRQMPNGSDSGFMLVNGANANEAPNVTVLINSTDPVWFFCRQTGYASIPLFTFRRFCLLCLSATCSHCQQGMVFAVNPTANMTFDAFQAAARSSSSGSGPSTSGSGASGSSAASAPSSTSSSSGNGKSGAITIGVRTGSLLAAVSFVAGLLL